MTTTSLYADLTQLLSPANVSQSESVRDQHSHDESWHQPVRPDVVVFAESAADVRQVLTYAFTHSVPVTPFAVGSSLEGHAVPVQGGISLDLMRMNRIIDVRPEDFLVCVEPGVTREELNIALRPHGLFFPVDPGANASLGGMAATNASGTTTVRYGAMRDNVRQLDVVLADGSTVSVGTLAAKSSSGYQLMPLFVGSEGTLGVITKLWLKVNGIPEKMVAARATFADVPSCLHASTAIIGAGVSVARIEFVEEPFLRAVNAYKGTNYPLAHTLFLEFHGSAAGVQEDVALTEEIAREEGCQQFEFETDEAARNRLWDARHSAAWAFMAQHPGRGHMATDVCVPLSKLPAAVVHARQVIDEEGACGAIVGHVGDGNFHASLAVKRDDAAEVAQAQRVNHRIVAHALALGGTCTGEHGVGLGKRAYQAAEHGEALRLMQAIKTLLDPRDILNPGKLVDGIDLG